MSKFSVKRPYTVLVGVIIVLILGAISFLNLDTDLLPEMDLPFIVVMTNYQGASPEEVEEVVTKPIEQSLATINNIKNISSVSSENSSMVILEFNNDANMDSSIIQVNSNLDLIKGFWNENVSSPMIMKLNPEMLPVMVASIDIEGEDIKEVSAKVRDEIIPKLESTTGVASVDSVGLVEESVEVSISQEKIDKLNNKILESIDGELLKAKNELNEEKGKLEQAESSLEEENKKQLNKLKEGKTALDSGLSQIEKGEKELDKSLKDMEDNRGGLEKALKELNDNKEKLKEGLELALLDPEKNQEKIKELGIKIKGIEEEEKKLEASLGQLNQAIGKLSEEKKTLAGKKDELVSQKEELAQGENLLNTEIEKAKGQIKQGKTGINQALKEIENQEDQAFKQANLEGVITQEMISGIILGQNFSMPAGSIEEAGEEFVVKVGDKLEDIEELKDLFLFNVEVESIGDIYLKDVADVNLVDNADKIYAKINGNNGLILNFQKQSGYSTSEVSKNIWNKVEEIRKEDPKVNILALMDQGEYIDIVVDSVLDNIVYGGLLAILILLIFLKDIKPTFVISLSVPISIVFAIALMYFSKVSINIISLAGLALGVGMLVDNSIVVIENIYRLRNEGYPVIDAAVEGSKEVAGAIIASTITTASVFLPIVFTKGISRQLFVDMGLTIAYSLVASLIVALSLVPMMSSKLLKNFKPKENKFFNKIVLIYERLLEKSLRHKWLVVVLAFVLLVSSLALASKMGTEFIPDMEAPQMTLSLRAGQDEDLIGQTEELTKKLEEIQDIETIASFRSQDVQAAVGNRKEQLMDIYLLLKEKPSLNNKEIEEKIRKIGEDLDLNLAITSSNMDMSQMGGAGVEVMVKGRDIDQLRKISQDIGKIVENIEGTENLSLDTDQSSSQLNVKIDKNKAMENELTVAQVYSIVNKKLAKARPITNLSYQNQDYPILVLEDKNLNLSRKDLEEIVVVEKEEEKDNILLKDIGEIEDKEGLVSITRESQARYVNVKASVGPSYNIGLVSRELEEKLKDYKLPEGYTAEIKGENEMINNSIIDLLKMMGLAIVLIYLIMVAQFQSLLSPFIVMFTIPLAFTGGLFLLFLTGKSISLIAMLGFLVLSGVVVNNGIVFVDYANQMVDRGESIDQALLITGKARIRPILMTALTTILGLLTLALGLGTGAEMLQPLAIVTIGGLAYATLLTLFVVPSMYRILNRDKKLVD